MALAPTSQNNILLQPNAFSKCAPNLSTNINQCGTVTLCRAKPMTSTDLSSAYTKSGDYRVMEALFHHEMEIKMCEAKQNGLFEFFMANKVNLSKKVSVDQMSGGILRIRPFVFARQYSQINNEYWLVSGGASNGSNWQVSVTSQTNIPADVRSFLPGERCYIWGQTGGGTTTKTAWVIVSSVLNQNSLTLVLSSYQGGSYLPNSRLASPVTGLLVRGTANVNDFEKFCGEPPAYLNWKDVPFWVETQRTSMCKSKQYDEWRAMLAANNPLYREYGDLNEVERNRQLAADWQRRMLNTMFYGTANSANQTVGLYDQLPQIDAFESSILNVAGGAQCVGFRADMVGIYEQLMQCGREIDLAGASLNMKALFNTLYQIMRVREASNKTVESIDLFTDSVTADNFMQAMIGVYNNKSQSTFRITMDVNQPYQKGEFGFRYRSFKLTYPAGLVINLVTHYFFDDLLTAWSAAGLTIGPSLWILDMAGIYPGIVASNRRVNKTGDLKTLAAIDSSYACVMEVYTQEQTLTSVTGTMVVECPAGCVMIDNMASGVPDFTTAAGSIAYPATTTTTTTTSSAGALYWNTEQAVTVNCPSGTTGASVTVNVPANTFSSTVSVAAANAAAVAWGTTDAQSQLICG